MTIEAETTPTGTEDNAAAASPATSPATQNVMDELPPPMMLRGMGSGMRKPPPFLKKRSLGGGDSPTSGGFVPPMLGRKASSHSDLSIPNSPDSPTRTTSQLVVRKEDGRKYVNQYEMVRTLGRGSYGKVKLCVTEEEEQFAAKIMNKQMLRRRQARSFGNPDAFRMEIVIMKLLNHESVITLYEVIDDPEENRLYMIMDFMDKGPLMEGFNPDPFPEKKALHYFRQLMKGLNYLHYQGILHRDIKPENLLLDSNDCLKIADFGVSQYFEDDNDIVSITAGSPMFMAPELVQPVGDMDDEEEMTEKPPPIHGKGVDVWACGVTLYMMLFGQVPFKCDSGSIQELNDIICTASVEFPFDVSSEVQDLLRGILTKDPEQRLTVKDILQHPWVTEEGTIEVPVAVEAPKVKDLVTQESLDRAITLVDKLYLMTKIKTKMGAARRRAASRISSRASADYLDEALPGEEMGLPTPSALTNMDIAEDALEQPSPVDTSSSVAEAEVEKPRDSAHSMAIWAWITFGLVTFMCVGWLVGAKTEEL